MKKVLFIYIVREGLGIASKAEKIEQGFRRAGCDLTVKSFIISEKKLPLLIQIIRLSFDVAYTLMKKNMMLSSSGMPTTSFFCSFCAGLCM